MSQPTGFVQDKVVLVTGAGGGIGRDFALALAREGAKVVVNDLGASVQGEGRDTARAQAVVDEIRAAGGQAVANGDSVSDWDGANRMVNLAVETFGRIDAVINNAGIAQPGGFLAPDSDAVTRRIFETNVFGLVRLTQLVLPGLRAPLRFVGVAQRVDRAQRGGPVGRVEAEEQPDDRRVDQTRHVHRAGVVADEQLGLGEQHQQLDIGVIEACNRNAALEFRLPQIGPGGRRRLAATGGSAPAAQRRRVSAGGT